MSLFFHQSSSKKASATISLQADPDRGANVIWGGKAQAYSVTFDLSILFHFFNLEFVLGMEY